MVYGGEFGSAGQGHKEHADDADAREDYLVYMICVCSAWQGECSDMPLISNPHCLCI